MNAKGKGLFRRSIELFATKKADQVTSIVSNEFDADFYLKRYPDVLTSSLSPLEHFLSFGCAEGRFPRADFDPSFYGLQYADELSGRNPFEHWISEGKAKGYAGHPWISSPDIDETALMRAEFDELYYARNNSDVAKEGFDLFAHFLNHGWRESRDPNEWFSVDDYLEMNPEIGATGLNPFSHYVVIGKAENRLARKKRTASNRAGEVDAFIYATVESGFDSEFYKTQFRDQEPAPLDPVAHYVLTGWKQGLNPSPRFYTSAYLAANPDVARAGVNPFFHYLAQGRAEGRAPGSPTKGNAPASHSIGAAADARRSDTDAYSEHLKFASQGDRWEEFDASITVGRSRKAKVLAYYLPQFHPIPENDAWWGTGFTEWRNVVRGQPRFKDHFQPRVPSDLGFYDLRDTDVIRRQAAMAKAAGIYGFCFYYYSFNGDRILERPIENFLAASDIDFPFALMWANENWTRTWDGLDRSILLEQKYRIEDEGKFIADVARHFADRRYIRINDRPLFFMYRPGNIPDSKDTIERWRKRFQEEHCVAPLLFMCQGFNDIDPRVH